MAIAASGAVSFSDLRTEYGASGAVSFSDFYRGAASGYIRALAANNTATNLSAGVPASGTINFTNFRSQARGFRFTFTGNATNQNASTLFGTDWGVDYPKDIVINSGVTLGGTSASEEALEISTGGLGTITITNNGTLIGAGGAANGGAGGDAFEAFVTCTLVNNGSILAGGGGGAKGGNGGTGGGGSYTSTSSTQYTLCGPYSGGCSQANCGSCSRTSCYPSTSCNNGNGMRYYYTCACSSTTNTNGGGGGAGGNGGIGAGYNQTVTNGSAGAAGANGGTNAGKGGTGGTGGNGGGYGSNGGSGSNGANGANGNRTNGAAGGAAGSAGAAGKSIRGISFATVTNNGTITGSQV